jgi:hypothetical protein
MPSNPSLDMYMSDDESDGGRVRLSPVMRPSSSANLAPNILPSAGVDSGQPAVTNGSGAVLQHHYSPSGGGGFSYQPTSTLGGGSACAPEASIAYDRYTEFPIGGTVSAQPSHLPATNINPQDGAQYPPVQNWPALNTSAALHPVNSNRALQLNHASLGGYLINTSFAINHLQTPLNPQGMLHTRPQQAGKSPLYGGDADMSDADTVDSQADFGSGPLRRAISGQPTIGAMAIDRPIPADRPESKRVLKARRKLMQTEKAKLSKELQRAVNAEQEEVIDLRVEIVTLQNRVLAAVDNLEIRKKKCQDCKACKISHHEGQGLCDPARLMQLLRRAELKAEKELLCATDRKTYETREEMRHMRVQKRAAKRREKEDAGLKPKKTPPRSPLGRSAWSAKGLQEIAQYYAHIVVLRRQMLVETQEQRIETSKQIEKLYRAATNAWYNKDKETDGMRGHHSEQDASPGLYNLGDYVKRIAFPSHQAVPNDIQGINAAQPRTTRSFEYPSLSLTHAQQLSGVDTLPHMNASSGPSAADLHPSRRWALQMPDIDSSSQSIVTPTTFGHTKTGANMIPVGTRIRQRQQSLNNEFQRTQPPKEEFNFDDPNKELPWRLQGLRLS